MKVHIPSTILNAAYESYASEGSFLSHLFGIAKESDDSIDLLILFATESSDKVVKNNLAEIQTFLPIGLKHLGVLIRQNPSVNLESHLNDLNQDNLDYAIALDSQAEFQLISLFSKNGGKFNKTDCEFINVNTELELLKQFGLCLSKYALCIQTNLEFGELEDGLVVPDASLSTTLSNFLKSQNFEQISLDSDNLEFPINKYKIIKTSEEDDFNFVFLFQVVLITNLNDEVNIIENNLKAKYKFMVEYLQGKLSEGQADFLTLAISHVESAKPVKDEKSTNNSRKTRVKNQPKRDTNKSNRKDAVDNSITLARGVPHSSLYNSNTVELDVSFNPSAYDLLATPSSALKEGAETRKLASLIFSTSSLISLGENHKSIPFTIPYYKLLSGKLQSYLGYNLFKQPYLIKSYDPKILVPSNIIINPHVKMDRPAWISPKTSVVSIISGRFAYYHYCVDDVNDNGWGCCYRSLQMVWSWYLLQGYTNMRVPDHWEIQQILNDNDTGGNTIKVGSKTWIGTVESSYIINWRLNMLCKIHYLSDSSYLPDYSSVISEHFRLQRTPIIIAAGVYAYVILGICVDAENEATYLIADPHYTGADNIKSISAKGVCWRRADFLNKATESGFINLLLPQIEPYKN